VIEQGNIIAAGLPYRRLPGVFRGPTARNLVFLMRRDANVPVGAMAVAKNYMTLLASF
jgi:hypothetical protein